MATYTVKKIGSIQALNNKKPKPIKGHTPLWVANDQQLNQNLNKGLYA